MCVKTDGKKQEYELKYVLDSKDQLLNSGFVFNDETDISYWLKNDIEIYNQHGHETIESKNELNFFINHPDMGHMILFFNKLDDVWYLYKYSKSMDDGFLMHTPFFSQVIGYLFDKNSR